VLPYLYEAERRRADLAWPSYIKRLTNLIVIIKQFTKAIRVGAFLLDKAIAQGSAPGPGGDLGSMCLRGRVLGYYGRVSESEKQ